MEQANSFFFFPPLEHVPSLFFHSAKKRHKPSHPLSGRREQEFWAVINGSCCQLSCKANESRSSKDLSQAADINLGVHEHCARAFPNLESPVSDPETQVDLKMKSRLSFPFQSNTSRLQML